jgi:acetylornithine deacetylase/succinyl-diaminopimelate desuccinylase-like protein
MSSNTLLPTSSAKVSLRIAPGQDPDEALALLRTHIQENVPFGAVLEFGMGEKFRELFDEVQRSNMSKVCKTLAEAEATSEYYCNERGVESYIREVPPYFLVYRKDDDKTLKSINYSPANLEQILL